MGLNTGIQTQVGGVQGKLPPYFTIVLAIERNIFESPKLLDVVF